MSSFAVHPFLTGLAVCYLASLALFLLTWLVGLRIGRFNVVDVAWGLGFVVIASTSYAWTSGHGADAGRRVLVLVLVAVWGLRLAGHIGLRSRGKGEDPRYDELLGRGAGSRALRALVVVFLLQSVVAWFVSLPVQAAMAERAPVGVVGYVGAAVWAVGVFFEAVGDAQLASFRRDPANRGQVMDRGLWHLTRHPNYFGDACLWAGLWLVAAQHWIGALTVLSPAAMYWFLRFKTGAALLERSMVESKPGYADYVRRTSGFFPWPPKG